MESVKSVKCFVTIGPYSLVFTLFSLNHPHVSLISCLNRRDMKSNVHEIPVVRQPFTVSSRTVRGGSMRVAEINGEGRG